MIKTGQALPLVATRILRPRMSRGVSAEQPRNVIDSRPRQQPFRECGLVTHGAHPRVVHVREQSTIAFCPRPLTRQRTVLERGQASVSTGREQATVAARTQSPTVLDFGKSASSIAPPTRTYHGPQLAMACRGQRIRVSVSPPNAFLVHIHFVPAYDLI